MFYFVFCSVFIMIRFSVVNDVVARVKADEQYHVPSVRVVLCNICSIIYFYIQVKSEINELLSQSLQLDEEGLTINC